MEHYDPYASGEYWLDGETDEDDFEEQWIDCDWSGVDGQMCDGIGSEHCEFYCQFHRMMSESVDKSDDPIPPTWAK